MGIRKGEEVLDNYGVQAHSVHYEERKVIRCLRLSGFFSIFYEGVGLIVIAVFAQKAMTMRSSSFLNL